MEKNTEKALKVLVPELKTVLSQMSDFEAAGVLTCIVDGLNNPKLVSKLIRAYFEV